MQIQDKIEKIFKDNNLLDSVSSIKDMKTKNVSKIEDIIINAGSILNFLTSQILPILCNSNTINRKPVVTLTKFSKYLKFLKKFINDFSFTSKPITKKKFYKPQIRIFLHKSCQSLTHSQILWKVKQFIF